MTLDAIRLANFKAFSTSQRVPLRPITLVFGANSAGKSSILHALALTHHAIVEGDLDTQLPRIGGESIDLGGFRQYVHRRDRERQVELAFELDTGRLSGRVAELLGSARDIVVELAIGEHRRREQSLSIDAGRASSREDGVRLERFVIQVDGRLLLAMSARRDGQLRLDRLDYDHPGFRDVFRAILAVGTTTQQIRNDDLERLGKVLDDVVQGITAKRHGLFPRIEEDSDEAQDPAQISLLPISRGRRPEDLAQAARTFLPQVLSDIVGGLSDILETEVRKLVYLGPLRSYPPRHLAFSQHHDPNWLAGGGHAWDVVRTREDVRARVNAWLGDASRLKTPYELQVRDLLPATALPGELSHKLDATLDELATAILRHIRSQDTELQQWAHSAEALGEHLSGALSDVGNLVGVPTDSEKLAVQWAREIVQTRADGLRDLVLLDKRSGTVVTHRDVGIGVSQVLPVLVSAYASRGNLVAIEQPEIHLHPALQADLGDIFLESALRDGGNTFLLETHSEHLILRILRRIRETTDGELPDGVPAVRPEQVAVLYVQPGSDGAEVLHMPITPDGEFERPWPGGFFPERSKELF